MGLLPNINFVSSNQNRRPKIDLKILKQLARIAVPRHGLSVTLTTRHL